MKKSLHWIALAAMWILASAAQASLVSLGNGTVLDTVTNLVWLQDWNVNGAQSWGTQVDWANNLTFAGSSDWGLPGPGDYTTLYDEVGDLTKVTVFSNVQSYEYWTSVSIEDNTALYFDLPSDEIYDFGARGNSFYAVAVRNATAADVIPSVPEPQTLALTLAALGAAVVARRKRRR